MRPTLKSLGEALTLAEENRADAERAALAAHQRADEAHARFRHARIDAIGAREHAGRAEANVIHLQKQINAIPGWVLYACGMWQDLRDTVREAVADVKADR